MTFYRWFDIISTMTEKKSMLDGQKQYNIGLEQGDVADFVILPGDPGRVEFIDGHLDEEKEVECPSVWCALQRQLGWKN